MIENVQAGGLEFDENAGYGKQVLIHDWEVPCT